MYSQCPECQARFRVTADDLRAARGTVRCGRCGSAFDALARLSDTIPAASEPAPAGRGREDVALLAVTANAVATTEYHFSADDLEKVFIDARDWQKQFGVAVGDAEAPEHETEPAAAGSEPPVVEVDENEGVEDITLEGERIRIEVPEGFDDGEHDLDSTDEFEVLKDVPAVEPPPAPVAATAPSTAPTSLAAQRWRREPDEVAAESTDEHAEPTRSGLRVLAWTLGSLVLALALLAQLTHHFRQDLVRHPLVGPPLRSAYERLGLPLSPDWDLAAFELRQWGNDSAAATDGRMSVRASLTNRAAFAQPHPVLRLELEDRFGETVAVRDFEPGEYLKDPSQASRMMGAGATTEAELLIADPGRDAVGYRLDICVRESASLLRCAQGQG
jgi:predicted Zn finger-like uncharacterized protein